ncbi:MAG: hypothetical protein GZ090_01375 [Oxalobacteraceae bacterium]|nr:hypothetical protein [Oxalobacteraceae bacterium]
MAPHRYWRAVSIESYSGGALEITGFHLLSDTTRVDATATLTANIAPSTGAVANLQDDDLATGVMWASSKGLVLQWDFGGNPADVTDIRLGSADDIKAFPLIVILQYSDDGVTWVSLQELYPELFRGIKYPEKRSGTTSTSVVYDALTSIGSEVSISNGSVTFAATSTWLHCSNAAPVSEGKWYFEVYIESVVSGARLAIGIAQSSETTATGIGGALNAGDGTKAQYFVDGRKCILGTYSSYGTAYIPGDTIGMAVDLTSGSATVTAYKNGVSQGVLISNWAIGPGIVPFFSNISYTNVISARRVMYPPSGYEVLAMNFGPTISLNKIRGKIYFPTVSIIPSDGATPDFSGVILLPSLEQDKDYAAIMNNSAGWGTGRITGTVKETGTPNTPVFKRVRLHRMVDGMLVREQWSDAATGSYAFNNIDSTYKFYVVSHDHLTNYNAVIKDNLTPEPMP